MAGTLLSAPTLGDASWSNWITLVDACRRGYLAASYTNFAGSAESAIAAGSLVEVAGAVYSFTETAIDYTGGGSANSDLYIYVKPDAVVSTASVVAWGSAPVWVDAKQGFYASAASLTRAIGGMYVGTAATYYHKYLYTPENVDSCLAQNTTRPILRKVVQLGEWDMDATAQLNIAHGLYFSKIRMISPIILNDLTFIGYPLVYGDDGGTACGSWYMAAGLIVLQRLTAGIFDSTSFNGTASTVPNRGWCYIEYEA